MIQAARRPGIPARGDHLAREPGEPPAAAPGGISVTHAARTLKISCSTAYAALASTQLARKQPQAHITEIVLSQVRDIRPKAGRL